MYLNKQYWYKHGYKVTLLHDGDKLSSDSYELDTSDEQYYKFKITDKTLNGQSISIHVLPL